MGRRQPHGMLAAFQHTAVLHRWVEVVRMALEVVGRPVSARVAGRAYKAARAFMQELSLDRQTAGGLRCAQCMALEEPAGLPGNLAGLAKRVADKRELLGINYIVRE